MSFILSLLTTLLIASPAFATMTLVSITGDSAQDLSTETGAIIYGGGVVSSGVSACTGDGAFTCDSCVSDSTGAGTGLLTCSKKTIYPSLKLTIVLSSTNTGMTSASAFVKNGTETIPAVFTVGGDGSLTAQILWSDICNSGNTSMNGCLVAGYKFVELTVGFNISGGSTDSLALKVHVKVSDRTDSKHTECPNDEAVAGQGFCYFEAYEGDGKIYADKLAFGTGYPATSNSAIEYNGLVFFYEAQDPSEGDAATIARISNKSSFITLAVTGTGENAKAENRITGLNNGTRYCLALANQDKTGLISNFTPFSGSFTPGLYCGTPSQVIGLLDDKSCFIATAAFGSDMAPEVQSFREFRNEYLLSNPMGRAFVKFYYKHSPYYANMIAESEVAKSAVRVALWPLLFFAQMSVTFGLWATLLILSLAGLSLYELYRRLMTRQNSRGEA